MGSFRDKPGTAADFAGTSQPGTRWDGEGSLSGYRPRAPDSDLTQARIRASKLVRSLPPCQASPAAGTAGTSGALGITHWPAIAYAARGPGCPGERGPRMDRAALLAAC